MKIKLDENMLLTLEELLCFHGHDISTVPEQHLFCRTFLTQLDLKPGISIKGCCKGIMALVHIVGILHQEVRL
jgi:hypothetical protein